jgi:ParB family chromosome partitioning protein
MSAFGAEAAQYWGAARHVWHDRVDCAMTAADMIRVYQREAEKQRLLVKKSDYAQAKLLFLVEALKELLADDGFMTLLRAEGLTTMPRALEARIAGGPRND